MWFWVGLAVGIAGTWLYFQFKQSQFFWRCGLCDTVKVYCPDEESLIYFKRQHLSANHPSVTEQEAKDMGVW